MQVFLRGAGSDCTGGPDYSAGPLHRERVLICAHISKDLQDQAFIVGGILLLAVLSILRSPWLQELRTVETI